MRLLEGVTICGTDTVLIVDRPAKFGAPILPPPPYPDAQERAYRVALAPLISELRERTLALIEDLDAFTVEDAARVNPKRAAALRAKIAAMREAVLARWTEERIVRQIPLAEFTASVDQLHQRATLAQLSKAIELSPLEVPPDAVAQVKAADGSFSEARRERWASANARLIKNLAEEHVDRVADLAADAVRHGSRASVLAANLRASTGITARRAKLVARDQIATLQGQVAQARQTRLGIERYRWRTAGDARVRTSHAAREGKIFSWEAPPADGHPGVPINCRCHPEPVLDDVLLALSRGEKTS